MTKKAKEEKAPEVVGAAPAPDADDSGETDVTMDAYMEETLRVLIDHARLLAGPKNLQAGAGERAVPAR